MVLITLKFLKSKSFFAKLFFYCVFMSSHTAIDLNTGVYQLSVVSA